MSQSPAYSSTSKNVCTAKIQISLHNRSLARVVAFPPEETLDPWLPIECPS